MSTIFLLDDDTINKIAAGEVVERPASVVKELVENSIDAKATAITVEIKDGGISFIRVTDNGGGIAPDDIDRAFASHATSKIKTAEDLLSVSSLGFRGEALSSIASVAQVEMITKIHRELTGIRYTVDGGKNAKKEEIGCPDGTTIIVRNLFFNTPARRKFLKTAQTEAGYVSDLIGRISLSRPDISFKFINNSQTKLHTSGNNNLRDIIYHVYGRDVTRHLLEVNLENDLIKVTGFIGKPALSRGTRGLENYFINGRYIKSNIITKAIEDAYKTFVMIHKFPFTAFNIDSDPAGIDVNVHPRKMEVRFTRSEEIYNMIYSLIRGTLEGSELIPDMGLVKEKAEEKSSAYEKAPEPFELSRLASYGRSKAQVDYGTGGSGWGRSSSYHPQQTHYEVRDEQTSVPADSNPAKPAPAASVSPTADAAVPEPSQIIKGTQLDLFDDKLLSKKSKEQIRIIGQLFETYWLIEYSSKLFIMDQHAAHEKVLYERLTKAFSERRTDRQLLSPPVIVKLTMAEQEIYSKYKDNFSELGFEIEPFGGDDFAISAVPLQLFGMDARDVFIEVLDNMTLESGRTEGNAITYKIATMACKAAVKGDNRLSFKEAEALIDELMEADDPYSCPHGRPTLISFTKYEIEKKFGRIQS
ncbi:MAG: DNA mismatch repair endonuclease MutL [Lachnospiraceae bacterium]|nr:DNA mismatch repair endonuclease MutL [Lachnospiraceae bacterium]